MVLSKYCFAARNWKFATVHGPLVLSSCPVITPWLVVIVMVSVPSLLMPVVGGVPTFLSSALSAEGVHVQSAAPLAVCCLGLASKPPLAQTMPSTTSSTARPAPIPARSCRRLRAWAARRAIWRSALARASARCRFLLVATVVPPGVDPGSSAAYGWVSHRECATPHAKTKCTGRHQSPRQVGEGLTRPGSIRLASEPFGRRSRACCRLSRRRVRDQLLCGVDRTRQTVRGDRPRGG